MDEPAHPVPQGRPPVAVLMPFAGSETEAERTLCDLDTLELGPRDELIVADNTADAAFARAAAGRPRPRVVRASGEASSYHARNAAAAEASCEWLLFIDADCRPPADLLDRYFSSPVAPGCALIAGGVEGLPEQDSIVARWSRSRSALGSEALSAAHPLPFGATANLMVRREAWQAVGGFQEGIRSGGDAEFCWRVQDRGWTLKHDPGAAVGHRHRESLRALARVSARYGAGRAWLNRHRPGSTPRPKLLRGLARCVLAAPALALTGRFERARLKLVDAVDIVASAAGYTLANRPPAGRRPSAPGRPPATAILCDSFPVLAETFIAGEAQELRRQDARVRIEAVTRPERPNRAAAEGLDCAYIEDEGYGGRVTAALGLSLRHPIRVVRDLVTSRRTWASEERVPLVSLAPMARRLEAWGADHLHAHFATGAAVSAARVARLLGVTHSVTAHAFEIFTPAHPLAPKLVGADFVTTGCEYNVAHLRAELGEDSPPLHEIVMGVDTGTFTRRSPYPGGSRVLAVGRFVPKKGFADLIDAASRLEAERPLDSLVIVGDGPLRPELEGLVGSLMLEHRVELPGALDPDLVRDELERADLLAMPCVVAPDGDRDSMPVVVKEALAMEVPVIATYEVGLPELVRPEFGMLVPPGDPGALAGAIAGLLAIDPGERAAMGARGREWVAEHASVARETAKLVGLIESASSGRAR